VDAFCKEVEATADVLWGSCDPVTPARPFAPLVDNGAERKGRLHEARSACSAGCSTATATCFVSDTSLSGGLSTRPWSRRNCWRCTAVRWRRSAVVTPSIPLGSLTMPSRRTIQRVLDLAPAAARRAADLGAHREACAHYAAALRFAAELDERLHVELLECHAREGLLVDDVDGALDSQEKALDRWRQLGDARAKGNCLTALSLVTWFSGGVSERNLAGQSWRRLPAGRRCTT
jgi:hypothetical protein